MAIAKRTNGNLIIQTPRSATSNITLDTDTVYISGNLTILGSTTAVETTNATLKDNIIMLNDGETGAGVTLGSAGISVDRGSLANVTLRWYEASQKWQVTSDGSTYANILTGTGAIASVSADPTPTLGGNLNTAGYQIWSSVNNINFNGNLQLVNQSTVPASSTGNTIVYGGTAGGGAAGVFVVNPTSSGQELITKARAFGFSLLL
jgi:hypothetical protein